MSQIIPFPKFRDAWKYVAELESLARTEFERDGRCGLARTCLEVERELNGELPPPLLQFEARIKAGEFGCTD